MDRADRDDPGAVLEPEGLREASELTQLLSDDDLESRLVLGWFHTYRCEVLPAEETGADFEAAQAMLIPCLLAGYPREQLPSTLWSVLAHRAADELIGLLGDGTPDPAIDLWPYVIAVAPDDDPYKPMYLGGFATTYRMRAETTSALEDFDEAVRLGREAVDASTADNPNHAVVLSDLAVSLATRYRDLGVLADLEEAIRLSRDVLAVAEDDDFSRPRNLASLGIMLSMQVDRLADGADLDEVVEILREAAAGMPPEDLDRATAVSSLGTALQRRFDRTGRREDLDESVAVAREAVAAIPEGSPGWAGYATNLGTTLVARFDRAGGQEDLNEAVQIHWAAVNAMPDGAPGRALYLSNLGTALRVRHDHLGTKADLDQAVQVIRDAIEGSPPNHADQDALLANLATTLQTRFERVGDLSDLNQAVEAARTALARTPPEHRRRAARLGGLGITLQLRHTRTGSRGDLDEAIQLMRDAAASDSPNRAMWLHNLGRTLRKAGLLDEAVEVSREAVGTAPPDHPEQAEYLYNLGVCLQESYERTGSRADLDEAATAFEQAAALPTATGAQRATATRWLGNLIAPFDQARAARLLEEAVRLLPGLALRHLDRGDQQFALGAFAGLATEAASLALENPDIPVPDRPARALELLESGRAILLGQALQDRSSLAEPSLGELRAEAAPGPIVVFVIGRLRCDALLLETGGVTSVPLPGMTNDEVVIEQVGAFLDALDVISTGRSIKARIAAQQELVRILGWVWDTAAGPVLDVLGYRGCPGPGQEWPRVWWAAGGLLGLLPIHAAGYHDASGRAVIDRVVSSYTPTIRALRHARRRATPTGLADRALIVSMPTTPGDLGDLGAVQEEADALAARLPGSLTLPAPTSAAVMEHLPSYPVAHFACHGANDLTDPSRSLLFLNDHETAPLTVAALIPLRLDNAQLAYLSACETARSMVFTLLDEAINLAAAFQIAGYPQVVGTLWAVNDQAAARIADSFYAGLAAGTGLDVTRAAYALHDAVRDVRDAFPGTPSLWAAQLHTGVLGQGIEKNGISRTIDRAIYRFRSS
jgi:tetratricopeptide (TPR) repeat protein